ncbi:MAG TPA: SRPBCC family protein [Burkholderiaceae bacterium]|nr:SRPBCC family protein [Burkholderiaceae bacterium]
MAYFQREIDIDVPASAAWDALRDVGNLHRRLVRGFVTDCEFDGKVRQLKFANGVSAAERIIAISEEAHRLSWSAVSERLAHHNASAQITPVGPGACRLVWTVDLLPDSMAPAIESMVLAGLQAVKSTLETDSRPIGVGG